MKSNSAWGRVTVVCGLALAATALPAMAGNFCGGPRFGFGIGWGGGWGNRGCGPGWGYGPNVVVRVGPRPVFYQRRIIIVVPGQGQRSSGSIYATQEVADVQAALNARGFDAGPVDGVPGVRTRTAISAYQQAKGLPVNGQINNELLAALDSNPANDVRAQAPTYTPPPATTSNPAPSTSTKPQTQTNTTSYPMGIVVEEKPGYVLSPYAQDSGIVDVRGIDSGTMVRCPYTSQIFIVP